jgi:PhnB protein
MKLTPFLLFDGQCAEAMAFYQACLGGELALTRLGDTPMKHQVPPGQHHRIAFAHLRSGPVEFSATDWLHPTRRPQPGNTVALYLAGESSAALRPIFEQLSAGADPNLRDDLREMPFGTYGHLADRFGVHWFFRGPPAGS